MEGSQTENSASTTEIQIENTARGNKDIKPMSGSQIENTNESLILTPMIESKTEEISAESLELKSLTMSQTENTSIGGPALRPMTGLQTENAASISINLNPLSASQTVDTARWGEEIKPMSGLGNEDTDTENIDIQLTSRSPNEDKGLTCHFNWLGNAYTELRSMPASRRRLVLFCIAHAMTTVLVIIIFGILFHQMKNNLEESIHKKGNVSLDERATNMPNTDLQMPGRSSSKLCETAHSGSLENNADEGTGDGPEESVETKMI